MPVGGRRLGRGRPNRPIVYGASHLGAPAGGQVVFDALGAHGAAGAGGATPTSPVTWSHTCTGSELLLLVGVATGGTTTGLTVSATYNSVSMTSLGTVNSAGGTNGKAWLFGLIAPATGANTVSVSFSGATVGAIEAGSLSFTGVEQSSLASAVTNFASATGTTANPSLAVTSATGNLVADLLVMGGAITSSADTQRWLKNVNASTAGGNGGQATQDGAASVTMNWTAAAESWGLLGVNIVASSGAGADQAITASGIPSGGAVGDHDVVQTAAPTYIPSGELVGAVAVTSSYTITAAGIPTQERTGDHDVIQSVAASGIQSQEASGAVTVQLTQTINASGIPSQESSGAHALTTTYAASAAGIPTGERVGNAAVSATYTITASGIPSQETSGAAALAQSIAPAGIPSQERAGAHTVTPGAVTVTASGIPTGEQSGTHVVALSGAPQTITASGIPSGEKLGTALVVQTIAATGIPSSERVSTQDSPDNYTDGFGTFAVSFIVSPAGIASSETFGNPVTAISGAPQTVTASSIPSQERLGSAAVAQSISAAGIPSSEAFGAVVATPGTATIAASGIPGGERFGSVIAAIAASQSVSVAGIPSQEAFGAASAALAISAAGIPSQERSGNAALTPGAVTISAAGIPSGQEIGMPAIAVTAIINAAGIPSGERLGAAALAQFISPAGIPSGERVGNTALVPATIFITAAGIPSAQASGSHLVVLGVIVIPSVDYEAVSYITAFEAVVEYAYDASAAPNQFVPTGG